jgi:ATP-dependent Zn protease
MEKIDKKVKEVLDAAYKIAYDLVMKHKDLHNKISTDLLEKEELSKEEFQAYFVDLK